MFAEIIPLETSLDHRGLTYFVPETLFASMRKGSLVEIPFREEIGLGVVGVLDALPPETPDYKAVISIIGDEPILAEYQVDAVYALAKQAFVHAHKALALFLPAPFVRQFQKKMDFPEVVSHREKTSIPMSVLYLSNGLDSKQFFDRFLLGKEGGSVLVFPTETLARKFASESGVEGSFYADSLAEVREYRLRCSVAKKESEILIWTRKLLFYNLRAYTRIFYFEESLVPQALHSFHGYDYRFLLERYAENGFEIYLASSVPSIASMSEVARWLYQFENVFSHENQS